MNSNLEHRLRLYSGLIIAFYLVLHLINASFGILSLNAMDSVGELLIAFWSIPLFGLILYAAFIVHVALMFVSLYRRRTLQMPLWNMLQFAMALALPLLLLGHIAGTRGVYELLGIQRNYTDIVPVLWGNTSGVIKQYALVILAWTHMAIGIHYWLRYKRSYTRLLPLLYPLCLFIPLLASLGFLRAGMESQQLTTASPILQNASEAQISEFQNARVLLGNIESGILWALALLLVSVLVFRRIRTFIDRKRGGYVISHTPSGKTLSARRDQTVLDTLREAGIEHAAVCGGRGRCTTCRIRVTSSETALPEPQEIEIRALQRIGAGPDVRLACQLKPKQNMTITPLLHPDATVFDAQKSTGVVGREQQIVCLFVDMRGSTSLGEQKLPYDVVFILNHFFRQLDEALRATDGHYATFNGDGLMALYGLDTTLQNGCRNALKGAVEIQKRMDLLNRWLADELKFPLKVGIGIHCGDAIVGTMGPPDAPVVSALGDNINITARLEALTKDYATNIIVSDDVLSNAGIHKSNLPQHTVNLRGRGEPLNIYTIDDSSVLTQLLVDSDSSSKQNVVTEATHLEQR